jgi:hypothetical protein
MPIKGTALYALFGGSIAILCFIAWVAVETRGLIRNRIQSVQSHRGASWITQDGTTHTLDLAPDATQSWESFLSEFRSKLAQEKHDFPPRKD